MKLKISLLLIIVSICVMSCDKDEHLTEQGYPEGIVVRDTISDNDCNLPGCSPERVIRLLAEDVDGKLYKSPTEDSVYFINYSASFDSQIQLILCDLPEGIHIEGSSGVDVRYSGNLVDACGAREAVWPIEELYFLMLTEIEKL